MTVGTCVVAGVSVQGRAPRHAESRRRRAQSESERRSDRSFVKALFICENSLDVSHYQHVCDGRLSSRRNSNLRVFCFRTARKKESNWENITIMILSPLHPSVGCSTSLAPHTLSLCSLHQLFLQLSSIHPNESFRLASSLKLPVGLRWVQPLSISSLQLYFKNLPVRSDIQWCAGSKFCKSSYIANKQARLCLLAQCVFVLRYEATNDTHLLEGHNLTFWELSALSYEATANDRLAKLSITTLGLADSQQFTYLPG